MLFNFSRKTGVDLLTKSEVFFRLQGDPREGVVLVFFPMKKSFPKRVAVIYNSVDEKSEIIPPDRRVADEDTVAMATDIAAGLKNSFDVLLKEIPFSRPQAAGELKADLVFNLCEGTGYEFACAVIDSLEAAGLPYVGANSTNYRIGSDKAVLNDYLKRVGLPTPKGQFFSDPDARIDPRLDYPLLVKPEFEHGSVGITKDSVVTNETDLKKQLKKVCTEYDGGAMVEEYIDGRELQLTLIGNPGKMTVLPIKEILFTGEMARGWHIVTFAAKWKEDSDEYKETPTVCPAENLSFQEVERLSRLGKEVFEKTECRDYTRIDIRYRQKTGAPFILDVNPNPDLSSDAAVARAATVYGWGYKELLREIVMAAWQRYGKKTISSPVSARRREYLPAPEEVLP